MSWNNLSMKDRASYIRMGVESGITDLGTIREAYNKFAEGGNLHRDGGDNTPLEYDLSKTVKVSPKQQAERLVSLGNGVYKDKISRKLLYNYDEMPTAEVTGHKKEKSINDNWQVAYAKGIPSGTMASDMKTMNAVTGGALNLVSPSQVIGATGRLINDGDFGQFGRNLILGNNGIVTDKFAQEHPYWSLAANGVFDAGSLGLVAAGRSGIKNVANYAKQGKAFLSPQTYKRITSLQEAVEATPYQWDYNYRRVIKNKHPHELQKLRDLHFLSKAPNSQIKSNNNIVKLYHGTPNGDDWHYYNPKLFGTTTDDGYYGRGLYLSGNKRTAGSYSIGGESPAIKEFYMNAENPYYVGAVEGLSAEKLSMRGSAVSMFNKDLNNYYIPPFLRDEVNSLKNYDAVVYKYPNDPFSEVVAPRSEQLKYSSPIVRDDYGKFIPISQRDNFTLKDFRYAEGGPIKKSYKDFSTRLSKAWNNEDLSKHDYDYQKYYNDNPEEAYRQLESIEHGGKGHFPDSGKSGTYKTPNHPTYPDLGINSWLNNDTIFNISTRQANQGLNNIRDEINTDRILDYLGSDLYYNNGATKVMYDGAHQLPTIIVTPDGNYTELIPNELGTGWMYRDRVGRYSDFDYDYTGKYLRNKKSL